LVEFKDKMSIDSVSHSHLLALALVCPLTSLFLAHFLEAEPIKRWKKRKEKRKNKRKEKERKQRIRAEIPTRVSEFSTLYIQH
jgi:hypothetical protein